MNTGAVADLYDGKTEIARHFFDASGKPTWQIFDTNTGAIQGMVQGVVKAKAARQRQQDDGGFGSVDALLLTASGGTGMSTLVVPAPLNSLILDMFNFLTRMLSLLIE